MMQCLTLAMLLVPVQMATALALHDPLDAARTCAAEGAHGRLTETNGRSIDYQLHGGDRP